MSKKDENTIITFKLDLSKLRCPVCNLKNRMTVAYDHPLILWCVSCNTYHQYFIWRKEVQLREE